MDWFKIRIFHFAKASVLILLTAASSVLIDELCPFAEGLVVLDAIQVFCEPHAIILSVFFYDCRIYGYYASNGEICSVYFLWRKAMVIRNL